MGYKVKNVSRGPIFENLDTKDAAGKFETLSIAPMDEVVLTDAQFASRRVQRHVDKKRLRARAV